MCISSQRTHKEISPKPLPVFYAGEAEFEMAQKGAKMHKKKHRDFSLSHFLHIQSSRLALYTLNFKCNQFSQECHHLKFPTTPELTSMLKQKLNPTMAFFFDKEQAKNNFDLEL